MIEALPNQVIHLNTRSKKLNLEKCGLPNTCTCDSLEVFDGLMKNASKGKWCETELDILSSGRFLKLIFNSNEDTSGGGFELEYLMLNKSKGGVSCIMPAVTLALLTKQPNACNFSIVLRVIAKGDPREVGHTISDSSQYLACIRFINLFSASIKL